MCSQEEQHYINGLLPNFHQAAVPDIWIGLSGTRHTFCFDSHCATVANMSLYSHKICEKCPLNFIPFPGLWCDQIRTRMAISDGWIKQRQILPTMVLVGPKTLQTPGTVGWSSQVEPKNTGRTFLFRKDQHDLSLCCPPGNYDGKWETTNCFKRFGYICEMTGGQNIKPTPAPGQSDFMVPLLMLSS